MCVRAHVCVRVKVRSCSVSIRSANVSEKNRKKKLTTLHPKGFGSLHYSKFTRSVNTRHRLIQLYAGSIIQLHTFHPSVCHYCDRCTTKEGTLLHLFFDWMPDLFWSNIYDQLSFHTETFVAAQRTLLSLPSRMQSALMMGKLSVQKRIQKDWKTAIHNLFQRSDFLAFE